jgi:CubicO group peptidase (beta-lactamase class C family)
MITFPIPKKTILAILAAISFQAICSGQNQIQQNALAELVGEAQKSHSDALVVWKDGKPYGEWYFGKTPAKIEAMSATKSVVNLAIGKLIADGKIKSVDQPVSEFYPEWKQGRKKNITIKQLLNHTSGLQNVPRTDVEIGSSPDFVQLALAAELSDDPGTVFAYNNKAVNLLAGIVRKASGKRMDIFVRETLFTPLGITNVSWVLDPAGNPLGMSGLQILPADFAKVGQLVLNRGRWNNQQLIAESWFELSLQPGQTQNPECGLLWWLIPERATYTVDDEQIQKLEAKGIDPAFIGQVRQLKGRYESHEAYAAAMQKIFGPDWQNNLSSTLRTDLAAVLRPHSAGLAKMQCGRTAGWLAAGYLGQYLVIVPDANLVVVRMISSDNYHGPADDFRQFPESVLKLANLTGSPVLTE